MPQWTKRLTSHQALCSFCGTLLSPCCCCHLQVAGFENMTGGYMTGGNAGTVKLTLPTAFTLSMLAWGMLEFPDVRTLHQFSFPSCMHQAGMVALEENPPYHG